MLSEGQKKLSFTHQTVSGKPFKKYIFNPGFLIYHKNTLDLTVKVFDVYLSLIL